MYEQNETEYKITMYLFLGSTDLSVGTQTYDFLAIPNDVENL